MAKQPEPKFVCLRSGSVQFLEAAAGSATDQKLPSFDMLAYTGKPMRLDNFSYPVVADLAGMKVPSQTRPVRLQHDAMAGVGHTTQIGNDGRSLRAQGVISRQTPAAADVVASGLRGFPWQASIGCSIESREFLDQGATADVNGQTVTGPCIIARQTILRELTICDAGADDDTSVSIAAQALGAGLPTPPAPPAAQPLQDSTMVPKFAEWLQAKNFDAATLSASQVATLQAAWSAETKPLGVGLPTPATQPSLGAGLPTQPAAIVASDPIAELRTKTAAELTRHAEVQTICAGYAGRIEAKALATIQAQAVKDGWDTNRTELECIRADRPKAPAGHVTNNAMGPDVLEAALRMASTEPSMRIEAAYKPEVLDRAHKMRGIGLRGLIQASCHLDGIAAPQPWSSDGDWERSLQAAFSTASLPGILSNTMNKVLLAAYAAVTAMAKRCAKKLTANDFKTHTGYRLTGDAVMKEVGPSGELKHGSLGEDSFTYSVKTYGRIYGITRPMLKNDDLGALMGIPQMLGRGAALALEDAFWTLVLANTGSFFAAGNKNLSTSSALASAGLAKATQKIRDQVDKDGNPIQITPKLLVVPTALEETAWELYKSTNVIAVGVDAAAKIQGGANIYAGLYEPIPVPYLGNSSYSGYSATSWYLFGDPQDIAAFGLAYLDGNEQPTIQDAPQASDVLGQGWRGFFDFGVCQLDPRGAVKCTA